MKGPGAAGAGAVHPHFHRAGEEQDLGVLAAQLDDHIGVGYVLLHSSPGGVHLLDKGDVQVLRQAHARRTRHTQAGQFFLGELLLDTGKHPRSLFGNLGIVPLVLLIHRLVLPVVDHTFQGGRAYVQTNFHMRSLILSIWGNKEIFSRPKGGTPVPSGAPLSKILERSKIPFNF